MANQPSICTSYTADREWSQSTAGIVVSDMLTAKILARSDFDRAVAIAAEAIYARLTTRDRPILVADRISSGTAEKEWSQSMAPLVADGLLTAKLIAPSDLDLAIAIAEEDIFVRLIVRDFPGTEKDY
jgi:hypothetical protein